MTGWFKEEEGCAGSWLGSWKNTRLAPQAMVLERFLKELLISLHIPGHWPYVPTIER